MSILVDSETRILIQGITGREGLFHAGRMYQYNGNVVAGVTPGKDGDWVLEDKIPVFGLVKRAVEVTGANASVIFVPARNAADAMIEAADAGISLVICITEGIPVKDMLFVRQYLINKGVTLIGPNSPGVLTPGEANVGITPGDIAKPGTVGVVSRSSTLAYEIIYLLKDRNVGVSTCVGIGGDPIHGAGFIEILEMFEADPYTEQVVLIGEIGGREEEKAAEFVSGKMTKPVTAFISGKIAPPEKRMGHSGAIIEGEVGRAGNKIKALWEAGVIIATSPEEIPEMVLKRIEK